MRMIFLSLALLVIANQAGCATQPVVTRTIYEDRSLWVRLEVNPDAEKVASTAKTVPEDPELAMTPALLSAWMRGFRAETDRGPIGMIFGRPGEYNAFVETEIAAFTPHLAKALKAAAPNERVGYCMSVDYTAKERFITTGWVYARKPYLYFRLVEYRTPVQVASPAVPTAEGCRAKPIPGTRTADRFFRLDYEPRDAVVKYGLTPGLMAGIDYNGRGEVVFKISHLYNLNPPSKEAPKVQEGEPKQSNEPTSKSFTRGK